MKDPANNLDNPANWDWKHVEVVGQSKSRLVVSVSFSGEQFDLIPECAENAWAKAPASLSVKLLWTG